MNGIRAILLDFGATLDGTSHWLDRFVEHYRHCGLELGREELDPAFSFATAEGYRRTAEMRRLGYRDLIAKLASIQLNYLAEHDAARLRSALASLDAQELTRLAGAVADGFAAKSARALTESREILARVAEHSRLGVVSNFYGNLEVVLAEAGILPLIRAAVDSSTVGFFKPDPRIFTLAVEQLEVEPREAAMVGDSWEKDCVAAQRAGLRAVWLRPNGRAAHLDAEVGSQTAGSIARDPQGTRVETIKTLRELERFIR